MCCGNSAFILAAKSGDFCVAQPDFNEICLFDSQPDGVILAEFHFLAVRRRAGKIRPANHSKIRDSAYGNVSAKPYTFRGREKIHEWWYRATLASFA